MQKTHRWHIIFFIELLCLLLFLPGCFRGAEKVYALSGAEMTPFVSRTEDALEFYGGESLALSPGVYQFRVYSVAQGEESAYVELLPGESGYRSLKGNGVVIFPGQEFADFEYYAVKTVSDAHLHCVFYNMTPEKLTSVELYRTAMGNRMAIVLLAAVFLTLDGLFYFRRKIRAGEVSGKQCAVFWTLVFTTLLAYLPYLTGYFSLGADAGFHYLRIEGLKESLLTRSLLPVRVQSNWLYGHGYAVSTFYSDFFLLFPAVLRIVGFSLMTSYKIFVLFTMAAAAVITYFCFYRCVKDRYAALFGTLLYLLAPYRLYNYYNREAVGEYLAMVFFPLAACGLFLLYTEDTKTITYKKYKWYLIWGLTAILQSHVLSTEMAAFFILLLCLVLWKRTFRKETFSELFKAALATLLLNAWFYVPMLYMMKSDKYLLQSIISGGIQEKGTWFANLLHLVPNQGGHQSGMMNYEAIQIGAGALLMILLYLLMLFLSNHHTLSVACCGRCFGGKPSLSDSAYQKEAPRGAEAVLLGFIFLSVFMSTKYFPWDAIAKLPGVGFLATSIQFPTRLMSPASFFCAMFGAFFCLRLQKEGGALLGQSVLCILTVITIGAALYQLNDIAVNTNPIFLYTAENMGTQSVVNGEYLLEGTWTSDYFYHGPVMEEGLISDYYEKNGTEIVMRLQNTTDDTRYLELPLTGYRGYGVQAFSDTAKGALPEITQERGAHGDLRLSVPPRYSGEIRVFYQGFPIFRSAEALSAITGLALLFLWGRRLRRRFLKRR